MSSDIFQERRKSGRVRVADGAFVCLTGPGRKLWHMMDIAPGGLSFRYVPSLETMEGISQLEIVTRDASFSLENVPFKTVSDIELKGSPGSHFKLRRCGVQFGSLTQTQTTGLKDFTSRYSTETA
jgi:hypothetical protein